MWALKNSGMIDTAILSFSVAGPGKDSSYAIFGGINENQIVGGLAGLSTMKTISYRSDGDESKNWALDGQTMFYGKTEVSSFAISKQFPAIIDTGSSAIGVPASYFAFLKEEWTKNLSSIDCVTDKDFC